VRLNVRMLGRVSEEILGMLHDELVERRRGRYKDRARTPASPACTAGALPGGSNRSGITRHHAGIERANIDSQLACTCGHDTQNPAVAQSALDLAAFGR